MKTSRNFLDLTLDAGNNAVRLYFRPVFKTARLLKNLRYLASSELLTGTHGASQEAHLSEISRTIEWLKLEFGRDRQWIAGLERRIATIERRKETSAGGERERSRPFPRVVLELAVGVRETMSTFFEGGIEGGIEGVYEVSEVRSLEPGSHEHDSESPSPDRHKPS